MNTVEVIAQRIRALCDQRGITPNGLRYITAVPQSTIKSILNNETKSPEVLTIKKLCDGLEMTLAQFFDTDTFNNLDQEIKKQSKPDFMCPLLNILFQFVKFLGAEKLAKGDTQTVAELFNRSDFGVAASAI